MAWRPFGWFSGERAPADEVALRSKSADDRTIRLNVLVVSPDSDIRADIAASVEQEGHNCTACRNMWTARIACTRTRPDLAFVDWSLPRKSATKLAETLFSTGVKSSSYVVAVIQPTDTDGIQEVAGVDVDDVITLPLDPMSIELRLNFAVRRITALRELLAAKRSLEENHERLVITSGGEEAGLWDWNLATNFVHYSSTWRRMLGYDDSSDPSSPEAWLDLVHEDDGDRLRSALDAYISGNASRFELTYRIRHLDGTLRWVHSRAEAVRGTDGRAVRLVGLQVEAKDGSDYVSPGDHDGYHDPLTGLPNRSYLMDRLAQAIARARRTSEATFAALFFDLDRFKNVNDSFGHLTGDKLLRSIAERVQSACRPNDTVARFGGDEFVIVVEDVADIRGATAVAERIQREFRAPFDLEGIEIFASISIGIALWDQGYQQSDDILRDADTAMYRAKAMGRNRYAVFDEEMHAKVVATLSLENDLRRALARTEFSTRYQPILALSTGRITGFEVLVRWEHPERGEVQPDDFIQVAEEMGLIIQMDRWVAVEACRHLRAWQVKFRHDPPLNISLNLSGTQFMQPDLVAQIDLTLRKSGLYGQSLKLEVTESVLMEDAQYAAAMLEQLRSLHIGISIDDFGTGYSSLSYLRRFGIDTLKIDRSFVSRMLVDEDSMEIVKTIVTLARNLGKETVAEGVETATQLETIRALGVDHVQGCYVSPPIKATAAEELLDLTWNDKNHLEKILDERLSRPKTPRTSSARRTSARG